MSQENVQSRVLTILKPHVKNEAAFATASNDTKLLEDLEINSARLVDILLGFEDEFDVEIDDDDADRVSSIGDVVAMVEEKIAA